MTAEEAIIEDMIIMPGMGATMSVGSDSYAYYVSEVLPNGIIGLYEPESFWDGKHSWEDGVQTVQSFNPEAKTELYIKRRYGHWWIVEKNGKPIRRFTSKWQRFRFGKAVSYRDPSFQTKGAFTRDQSGICLTSLLLSSYAALFKKCTKCRAFGNVFLS